MKNRKIIFLVLAGAIFVQAHAVSFLPSYFNLQSIKKSFTLKNVLIGAGIVGAVALIYNFFFRRRDNTARQIAAYNRRFDQERRQARQEVVQRGNDEVLYRPQDGNPILISGGLDTVIRMWDIKTEDGPKPLGLSNGLLTRLCVSPDGKLIASVGHYRVIKIFDAVNNREIVLPEVYLLHVHSICFSNDSKKLFVLHSNRTTRVKIFTVKVFDIESGQYLSNDYQLGFGYVAEISPNGKYLALVSRDNTVKIFDIATRQEVISLIGHADDVRQVCFNSDGTLLACASQDEIKIWDVQSGREVCSLGAEEADTGEFTFSPDGQLFAQVSSNDTTIKLWNIETRQELLAMDIVGGEDERYVSSLVFSPDGQMLASGYGNGRRNVWDVSTGVLLRSFEGLPTSAEAMAFIPDALREKLQQDQQKDRDERLRYLGEIGRMRFESGQADQTRVTHSGLFL